MDLNKIPFNDLPGQWAQIRDRALISVDELGQRGDYIGGKAIEEFENLFSNFVGSQYAVGVSNGTDALKIGFQLFDLGEDDAVVLPANTFIADYIAVKNCPNGSPRVILVDHDENYTMDMKSLDDFLSKHRNSYRKLVVVPVHLYGHPCDMDSLMELKNRYDFLIMEDCSQAHGTLYNGRHIGNIGEVSAYSLYPGKNLGALGDAGILTMNDEYLYKRSKSLRNYGSSVKYHYDELGHNHRMDTIQAIFLSEKLKRLNDWTVEKRSVASRYLAGINNSKVQLPVISKNAYHSFHIFCVSVDKRDSFMSFLEENGIPTIIHYPIPIHETKVFEKTDLVFSSKITDAQKDRIVSLPIHPFMSHEQIDHIIKIVNKWV